ncbi:SCP2 sterol-binding domain-containing protein [Bradyrhizobium tunisiense]|uniref:SCP2 sterol-binding domain-containing protein n=1 Tax=Bradyrhizobium tunisiense TaxID=3278709 RepID=UPI0035DBD911
MAGLKDHPIADRIRLNPPAPPASLSLDALKALVMECGADDCGVVSLDDPLLRDEAVHARRAFAGARLAVSIVSRTHRAPIRSPTRSAANNEFHQVSHDVDDIARELVGRLEDMGISAMNPPMAFPMEFDRYPERGWVVSHKLVAEAAGMGKRGIHRSVIHPKFGSFILLGTVLVDLEIEAPATALDYNPCFECKLCVVACPVGALKPDGYFDFSSCLNHNYQQFMGGFAHWIEDIADAKSAKDYRSRQPLAETVKRWQSLSYGPNYNAAYCVAVCPAGEHVMADYLADRKAHVETILKPLQEKIEPLYVVRDSDAASHAAKMFPHKTLRFVRSSARATSIGAFLFGMGLSFQRGKSKGLNATYHFVFTGEQPAEATVVIKNQKLTVTPGLTGTADLRIQADSTAWLQTLTGRLSVILALAQRKIRLKGPLKLLKAFGACFPK